jgi:hypothetical protein
MPAGYKTPGPIAVMYTDGGGDNPDQISIVYADEDVPTCEPECTGKGKGCGTLAKSAVANVDPESYDPPVEHPEQAYQDGQVLFALELDDCNGDGEIGITPFALTKDPEWAADKLKLSHNPGGDPTGINLPGGFNREVQEGCAVIGLFHIVQYRINPLPPDPNPMLERRDLAAIGTLNQGGGAWIPVSNNIENLQFQYAVGASDIFQDAPPTPRYDDPTTWITRVKVTVFGRSESRNLQGATSGVFAADDTHLRRTFSTTVTLRDQVYEVARETLNANYN